MPEQQSVLTFEDIRIIFENKYRIVISGVKTLLHGSANCFRVSDGSRSYFLKEFQSHFNEDDLRRETDLIDFLQKSGYQTAKIMPSVSLEPYFKYKGRFILLQEWIDGITYTNNCLPRCLLMEAAELLGKLHNILRDYPLPRDMDTEWLNAFSPDNAAVQYDELLTALEAQKNDILYEHIKSDLIYKMELVKSISEYKKYFNGITFCATHGDYTCFQYLCGSEHIIAVIDFSSARTLPVVWEIMRSYIQSSDSCKNGAEFNTDEFRGYIGHYLKHTPLSAADLGAMPYVYLHQLARSKYGYKEYLITKTANKTDLINFAFWRTDICREIYRKKEEIADRLRSLI